MTDFCIIGFETILKRRALIALRFLSLFLILSRPLSLFDFAKEFLNNGNYLFKGTVAFATIHV